MQIVLLSGGSGTRLWPLSNNLYSKQFLKILPSSAGEDESMLQRVFGQIKTVAPEVSITIATAKAQQKLIQKQLGGAADISVEPCRRDTFPAIALVCAYLHEVKGIGLDEPIIICPVDPYVELGYFEMLKQLSKYIEQNIADIMLMGIEPSYPSTKYGYIIPDSRAERSRVLSFREKPDADTADKLIAEGALWNSGVLAFRLGYVIAKAKTMLNFSSYEELFAKYTEIQAISFDYAVLEREKNIGVIRYSGKWRDMGTWNTVTEVIESPLKGNAVADEYCDNLHVVSTIDIPIIAMGLKDVVIAASHEGIFIADKERSAHMKPYVDKVDSPIRYAEKSWGEFQIIDIGKESLTIKVTLEKGASLTYHRHEYRDEVWTIIEGEGFVNLDDEKISVSVGSSINIPRGTYHTIKAKTHLKLIEVQTGEISAKDKELYPETVE